MTLLAALLLCASLAFAGCRDLWGFLPGDNSDPPYRWSIARGFDADEVLLSIPHDNAFAIARINVSSGDGCLLAASAESDSFSPAYHHPAGWITFVTEDRSTLQQKLIILQNNDYSVEHVVDLMGYDLSAVAVLNDAELVFAGRKMHDLASAKELYRCSIKGSQLSCAPLTSDERVDDSVFYAHSLASIFWNKGDDQPEHRIVRADAKFSEVHDAGRGTLVDYSDSVQKFLVATGIGRFALLSLWDPATGERTTIADNKQRYFIDAAFACDGATVLLLSSDPDNVVFVDALSLSDSEMNPAEVARFQRVNEAWQLVDGGTPKMLRKCENDEVK